MDGIEKTTGIVEDVRSFNKQSWVVRYPTLSAPAANDQGAPSMRRSLSFADDPTSAHEVVVHPGLKRSITLATLMEDVEVDPTTPPPQGDFQVIRLDLSLGPTTSPAFLVTQLEKTSIASLLDDRLNSSLSHLSKLQARVQDTSSKVLITGDLNSGKSTFVNALLRRDVMPVDQQPLTGLFCEVHDASGNEGVEEVHILVEGKEYNAKDDSTFTRASLDQLESLVSEPENAQKVARIYVRDTRSDEASLLHNGLANISLIDAPGLNRDSLKTTALFARQEEIDVVVFVVSAENHFTLSAKEFLWQASREKSYVFVVVNKFDVIRDAERCKKTVGEQVKGLSRATWEDKDELLHFVDSRTSSLDSDSFKKLEQDLRSFVLIKRSKSKLQPATTYLTKLLADLELLASSNEILAGSEKEQAEIILNRVIPILDEMIKGREGLEESLENIEEDGYTKACRNARDRLRKALERVEKGESASEKVSLPAWPGVFRVWDYARDVREALLKSLDDVIKGVEDDARVITAGGVKGINAGLADKYLPAGTEKTRRVFVPSAMFSPRKGRTAVVGLGLARPEMLEVNFLDIMDLQHQLSVHLKTPKSDHSSLDLVPASGGLAVGALTLLGGKALGLKGALEGIVRVTDLLSNQNVRKWVAPVVGGVIIGVGAWVILRLEYDVPKNVGRRIKAELERGGLGEESVSDGGEGSFVGSESNRVGKETRKVLRLAAWDLRERFRGAMVEREREVKAQKEVVDRAEKAGVFFSGVVERCEDVREGIKTE